MPQKQKILFFIAGPVPTEDERAAAEKLDTRAFRNAAAVGGFLEQCGAVAGCAPEEYLAKFPRADAEADGAKKQHAKKG